MPDFLSEHLRNQPDASPSPFMDHAHIRRKAVWNRTACPPGGWRNAPWNFTRRIIR